MKGCRHCGRKLAQHHGRGLCPGCHHKPDIRSLYPRAQRRTASDPEVSEAELDAMIEAQRAKAYRGGRRPAAKPRRADYWATRAAVYKGEEDPPNWVEWLRGHGDGYELHPDTEPEAIAADQREAVRAALEELGAGWTVERVSEAAILPVWTVTRRLTELGVL